MFKSPSDLKIEEALKDARRILLAAGSHPTPSLQQRISIVLAPDTEKPTTPIIDIKTGDRIQASVISSVAKGLHKDVNLLSNWFNKLQDDVDKEHSIRDKRRQVIERRIRSVVEKGKSLERYSTKGSVEGVGALTEVINFTRLDKIDFTRTTCDITPAGGIDADGEALLSRDSMKSIIFIPAQPRVIDIDSTAGVRILTNPLNIFTRTLTDSLQMVVPGGAEGSVDITYEIADTQVTLSCIDIEGLSYCEIQVWLSDRGTAWEAVGRGKLSPQGRTSLKFLPFSAKYIRIRLSNPMTTPGQAGEAIGIKRLLLSRNSYVDSGELVTQKLLGPAAPLSGVRISANANVPDDTSIDLQVSFAGPDGPFVKSNRLTSSNKQSFVVWTGDTSRTELSTNSLTPPSDTTKRFWKISNVGLDVVQWDSELFVGENQWWVETKEVMHEYLDFPYKIPSLYDWSDTRIDGLAGGVFTSPAAVISGNITTADWDTDILTGSVSELNPETTFLYTNRHSYAGDAQDYSMLIFGSVGTTKYMAPGREYRMTTYIHALEEVAFKLSAHVPGTLCNGGTFCFAYYINGREVLSVGDTQLPAESEYSYFSTNTSFSSGWNKIDVVIYRPNQTYETNPIGTSALRLSLEPLNDTIQNSLNLTVIRARKESLSRTNEFALRVLKNPGNRSIWAWQENTSANNIVLASDWNNNTDKIVFDGIALGEPANFNVSFRTGDSSLGGGVWVRALFRGTADIPPTLNSIKVEAIS